MKFKIIEYGSDEYKLCVNLREEILRKPIGLTFTSQEIEQEKDWIHIAGFKDGRVCATAAIIPEGERAKICRVAVSERLQGNGIGTKIMRYVENYIKKRDYKEIYLHARDTSIPFYLKNHYIEEVEWFTEDTVPHKKLTKGL